jgi:hypothetical protein
LREVGLGKIIVRPEALEIAVADYNLHENEVPNPQ